MVCGLSLVMVSGRSSLAAALRLLSGVASLVAERRVYLGHVGSLVVVPGLSCPCAVFLHPGIEPMSLRWQADS